LQFPHNSPEEDANKEKIESQAVKGSMINDTPTFVRTSVTKIKNSRDTPARLPRHELLNPKKKKKVEQAESRCLWCGVCLVGW